MNKNEIEQLKKAKELIDFLCEHMEREAPLHNVQAFLTVAAADAEGKALEVKEIQQRMGMTSSALSRALGALGEWSYKNRPGLDLVKARPDYTDRRRKPMVLTEKGEKLAKSVSNIIE